MRFDRLTWVVALGMTLGIAGWTASNWFLGAMVDSSGLSVETAGLIEALELGATGVVMIAIAPILPRLNFNLCIRASGLIILATFVASAWTHDPLLLGVIRSIAGIGFGVIYALILSVGGGAPDPDRTYARAAAIQLVISMAIGPSMGWAMDRFGQAGVFLGMGIYCGLVFAALVAIPLASSPVAPAVPTAQGARGSMRPVVAVLTAFAFFGFATNGLFVFLERLGRATGLTGALLGTALASSGPIGTLGSSFAAVIGTRFGRALPLLLTLMVTGLANAALFFMITPVPFVVVLWLWMAAYWASYPYLLGLAAVIDSRGRVASLAGSILVLSGAFGNYGAAYIGQHWGLGAFGAISFILCLAAGLLTAAVALFAKPPKEGVAAEA